MEEEKREEMIEKLVQYQIDCSIDSMFYDVLVEGFKGYENYSDKELQEEYRDVFNN